MRREPTRLPRGGVTSGTAWSGPLVDGREVAVDDPAAPARVGSDRVRPPIVGRERIDDLRAEAARLVAPVDEAAAVLAADVEPDRVQAPAGVLLEGGRVDVADPLPWGVSATASTNSALRP